MTFYCISHYAPQKCTACTACIHSCPVKCITMQFTSEGFLLPKINLDLCIQCGACSTVCPEINSAKIKRYHLPEYCFAAIHNNDETILQSSSGGAFSAILQCFKNDRIFVYGARYTPELRVEHYGTSDENVFSLFKKAKYVQSDLNNVLPQISEKLNENKTILFSGMPCQIAGLKSFLGKEYDNLICIELLCHGVGSPGVFKDYIEYIEQKHGKRLSEFIFRDKIQSKGLWKDFMTTIKFEDGKAISSKHDLYTRAFLIGLLSRDSCLSCPYASVNRVGDIVIGDFWGIEETDWSLSTKLGVSLIIPLTTKGNELVNKASKYMTLKKYLIESAIRRNTVLYQPTKINTKREQFFMLYNIKPINIILNKLLCPPSLLTRFIRKIKKNFLM